MAKNKEKSNDSTDYYGYLRPTSVAQGGSFVDKIINKTDELATFIKDSQFYKDYVESKKGIDCNESLREKIDFYKSKHFAYQTKLLNDEPTTFEEEKEVSALYAALLLNADAKHFLQSEANMLKIFRTVVDTIAGVVSAGATSL